MYADTLIGPPGSRGKSSRGRGKERYSRQIDELDYIVPRGGYYFEVCCCEHSLCIVEQACSASVHMRKHRTPIDLMVSRSMMIEMSGILRGVTNSKVRPGSRFICSPLGTQHAT